MARSTAWRRTTGCLTLVALLAALSTAGADARYAEIVSPTQGEVVLVDSQSFPDYSVRHEWKDGGAHRLAKGAPIAGTFGVVFDGGAAIVVEVFIEMRARYLHALVLYEDGRTPRLFVKQGVGAIFREEPIDPAWTPERLVPAFRGRMS